MTDQRIRVLVNLPSGFFRTPSISPIFERLGSFAEVRFTSHDTADAIREDLAWAEAVLMWSWPPLLPELLDAAPNLRIACQLDLTQAAARTSFERELPVSVSRSGFSPAVSEMALALILAGLRQTSTYHCQMWKGEEPWVGSFPDDIDPHERELSGRPVGVIGFGQIGRRLIELLKPFHCPIRVADPFVSQETIGESGAQKVELRELMAASDVVVICAASNAGTAKLIGRDEIEAMPANALLVNVARAALVDYDALTERLQRGDLFAAIDVFDQEPLSKDHVLRTLPNAYLTPHRGGGVMASVERILGWLVDDLEAFVEDRPRKHGLTEAMIPSLDA